MCSKRPIPQDNVGYRKAIRPAGIQDKVRLAVILLCLFGNSSSGVTGAEEPDLRTPEGKRIYRTQRLQGPPPRIDGVLDDVAWQEGYWSGGYRQFMPEDGAPPSRETEIKILYDDKNIYVAFRLYDDPELIDRRLGRRDQFDGDIIGVCFDSYFDHRTGFEFDLTAGGSKIDLILLNTGWDTSWDPIWEGKVSMTDFGWTAEMRIPLNQLRYADKPDQIWGLHSWRWINRLQEEDQWNPIGRDNPGHLYSIGELHGLRDLPVPRRIELLPYTAGSVTDPPSPESRGGSLDTWATAGLDGKVGLGSAFTLDFTMNPDFGQVEADPAVLNISAFETFYQEKRPFFLEGKQMFQFDMGEDLLFYSRRIGQSPSYRPQVGADQTVESPTGTTILGAAKVTGKTDGGLTLAALGSLTQEESAVIRGAGEESKVTTEPAAAYAVLRVQQDFDRSNTFLGGMLTAADRRINDSQLEFLAETAVAGGLDFRHHWRDKAYYLDAKLLLSDVRGSTEALTRLQEAPARYFQRPDADHLDFDPGRTHLSGHGGTVEVGKGSRGRWRFFERIAWRSPGLDLNDLGYLRLADVIQHQSHVRYEMTEPRGILREYTLGAAEQNTWDFGGDFLEWWVATWGDAEFRNNWGVYAEIVRVGIPLDTRLLRGGPAVRREGLWDYTAFAHSDPARPVSGDFRYKREDSRDGVSLFEGFFPAIRYRIRNPFLLSAELEYSRNRDIFQYVARVETSEGTRRDLVARLDQRTLGLTFRVDWALSPELTVQYYANPFVSVGTYSEFKYFKAPRADNFSDRFHTFTRDEILWDVVESTFRFDETGDGIPDYSMPRPDFNFREFHSNLVLRWEYRPGSTLFVVWTQGRSAFELVQNRSLRHNLSELFSTPAENIFLVKLTYWLPF
ncbi:MAG TPA: DUF5916 domain-containing protein [Acidobacteriota bacterium]|nr:DUF5916 domain-containing protein [Acidobacteriota bacterium]HRV08761.1 DUF5916 domain-containing protein [Acidobacteriota bacterium]